MGHICPVMRHICPNLGLVFNINALLPKIHHFLRLGVAKLPILPKNHLKTGSPLSHRSPQPPPILRFERMA